MNIIDPLISVLIAAGILSLAIAQEEIPASEQNIIEPTQVQRFIRYLDNRIRSKCERNGGPKAYERADYKGSEQRFTKCFESLVNITEVKAEMAAAKPHGEQKIVIQNYCRRVPTFKNCLTYAANLIKPCLDPEEHQSVNILHEITSFMLEFVCENGDAVENLLAAGVIECLASKYPVIQTRCYKRIFELSNFDDVVTIPGLGLLPKLSLDLNGCRQLQEYQRCSVPLLNECENSVAGNVANDVFNFFKNKTYCKILLNQQTTNSEDEKAVIVEHSRATRSVRRETYSFEKRGPRSISLRDIRSIKSEIEDRVKSVFDTINALLGIVKSGAKDVAKSVSDAANVLPGVVNSVFGDTEESVSSSANTSPGYSVINLISAIIVAILIFLRFV